MSGLHIQTQHQLDENTSAILQGFKSIIEVVKIENVGTLPYSLLFNMLELKTGIIVAENFEESLKSLFTDALQEVFQQNENPETSNNYKEFEKALKEINAGMTTPEFSSASMQILVNKVREKTGKTVAENEMKFLGLLVKACRMNNSYHDDQ